MSSCGDNSTGVRRLSNGRMTSLPWLPIRGDLTAEGTEVTEGEGDGLNCDFCDGDDWEGEPPAPPLWVPACAGTTEWEGMDGCGAAMDGCGAAMDGCGAAMDGCGAAMDGCGAAMDGCGAGAGEELCIVKGEGGWGAGYAAGESPSPIRQAQGRLSVLSRRGRGGGAPLSPKGESYKTHEDWMGDGSWGRNPAFAGMTEVVNFRSCSGHRYLLDYARIVSAGSTQAT